MTLKLEFQQSECEHVEVPQLQFLARVLDTTGDAMVQTVQKTSGSAAGAVPTCWWTSLRSCSDVREVPRSDAFGRVWACVRMLSTGVYWVLEGTSHTQRTLPTLFTASPGRYLNTGQG